MESKCDKLVCNYPLRAALKDAFFSWILLCRILMPVMAVLIVLQQTGGIDFAAGALEPLMHIVNLPAEFGIVWAVAIIANFYAAIAVLATLAAGGLEFTVAEISVLASMMLFAHALWAEGVIVAKAGIPFWQNVFFRLLTAMVYGFLLSHFYSLTGLFQETVDVSWLTLTHSGEMGIPAQILADLLKLAGLFVWLISMYFVLWVVRVTGMMGYIERLMAPVLASVGIQPSASFFVIIGMFLGIFFGAGFLISEIKKGHIDRQSAFRGTMLLCMVHAIVEDTLLMLAIGAEIWGILILRFLFSAGMLYLLHLADRSSARLQSNAQ